MNREDQVLDDAGMDTEKSQDDQPTQPAETNAEETEPTIHASSLDNADTVGELVSDDTKTTDADEQAKDESVEIAVNDTATNATTAETIDDETVADEEDETEESATETTATVAADTIEASVDEEPAKGVDETEATETEAVTTEADTDEPSEETIADDADEAELSDEELFLAALEDVDEESFKQLKRGDIITGTIASKSGTEILVDVGAKSEGIITERETKAMDAGALDSLEVGSEVDVYVLTPENKHGHVVLSINRAREAHDWQEAQAYLASEENYETKIAGFNKGGLIAHFGEVRGFIPASQVSAVRQRRSGGENPQQRWGDMVGEDITVKVIEVDRDRNRLILSERAAAREVRKERRAELIETLSEGQILTGRVVRLTNFGAFVDIGGADGLVHLSELDWKHVKHPKDVLDVGEQIKVEVISLDAERQRIGLSRKRCLDDPWETIAEDYHPDELVQGKVTKLTKFGAFARLVDQPAIEGLVHISELADRRVNHPSEVVEEGDVVTLRIIRIEPERRRLGLSLKRVDSEKYLEEDWKQIIDGMNEDE